jgi:hypothetical protein
LQDKFNYIHYLTPLSTVSSHFLQRTYKKKKKKKKEEEREKKIVSTTFLVLEEFFPTS